MRYYDDMDICVVYEHRDCRRVAHHAELNAKAV